MSILSQGTELYLIDPADDSVLIIKGVTNFNPGGSPADQIEDTTLELNERTYKRGLRTPGQASMTLNADPRIPSHIRLHELSLDDAVESIEFVVGWSDGTEPPTVDVDGKFVLPTTRTWFGFTGYIADFPLDFSSDTVVTSEVSVQRSGVSKWTKKVPV